MRVFISIDIQNVSDIYENIKSILNSKIAKINWVKKENIHLTLRFIGDVDKKTLECLKRNISTVKFNRFEIKMKGVDFFPNEKYVRVLWIGVKENIRLRRLYENVCDAISKCVKLKNENFIPHITIARIKYIIDKNNFRNVIRILKSMEFERTFNVNVFHLKKSELNINGPIYTSILHVNAIN